MQSLTTILCSDGVAPGVSGGHQQQSSPPPQKQLNGGSPVRQLPHHRETTFGVADDDNGDEHSWEVPQQSGIITVSARPAASTNGPLRSNGNGTMLVNGTPPQVCSFCFLSVRLISAGKERERERARVSVDCIDR